VRFDTIERNYGELIRINAPDFYRDPDFLRWLDHPDRHQATWHNKGTPPGEFSDLFFTYDQGEGSDSDMPGNVWDFLHKELSRQGVTFALVWVSNLPE